ncbi:hypothetical protein [Catenulispora sp. GP43]
MSTSPVVGAVAVPVGGAVGLLLAVPVGPVGPAGPATVPLLAQP